MRLARLFGFVCAVGLVAAVSPVASLSMPAGAAAVDPPPPPAKEAPAKLPTVDEEYKAGINQTIPIVVKAKGSVEKGIGYKATFSGPPTGPYFTYRSWHESEHKFEFQSAVAGRYTIVFWVKGEIDGVVTTVVVGDGTDPTPTPPNPSKKAVARVVIVTDGTAAQRIIRTPYETGTFPADYEALGLTKKRPDELDKGDVVAEGGTLTPKQQELLKKSEGKKLPQYFFLDADKTVLEQGDLPEKPADLIKKIKEFKGK